MRAVSARELAQSTVAKTHCPIRQRGKPRVGGVGVVGVIGGPGRGSGGDVCGERVSGNPHIRSSRSPRLSQQTYCFPSSARNSAKQCRPPPSPKHIAFNGNAQLLFATSCSRGGLNRFIMLFIIIIITTIIYGRQIKRWKTL